MNLEYRARYLDADIWTTWRAVPASGIIIEHDREVIQLREKPSFEPGYFVLVQDVRADGAPWLVKWFDENPGNDWDRAVIVNDHLE